MLKRTKAPSAVPVIHNMSIMETLENISPDRIKPEQISSNLSQVNSDYHNARDLHDVAGDELGNYIETLASRIMKEFYPAIKTKRVSEEVAGEHATNFSRMQFFHEIGSKGLMLSLDADNKDSKRKRAAAIEALLAAAYFGSGIACQLLFGQNAIGVIVLTSEEIQCLIEAQIYWHDRAFGPYEVSAGQHNYTNIDLKLQPSQCLPTLLLTDQKVWDAVRAKPALFEDILRVAFHSGRAIQELLDQDQIGTFVILSAAERRRLVQDQIKQYFAAQVHGATIKVEDQQTPALAIPSKVWDALMDAPKESWNMILQFVKDLDVEFPLHLRMTNPEGLARFTEDNPMDFKAYFESKSAQALVSVAGLDSETKNRIETRNRAIQALLGLRHAAFKPDNKALLDMRPAIAAKKAANKVADDLAGVAITAETAEVAKKKEAVKVETAKAIKVIQKEEEQDILTCKISYKREGFEKLVRSSLNTESLKVAMDKAKDNPGVEKYTARIELFMSTPEGVAYTGRKATRDLNLVRLSQEEQASYERLDAELATFVAVKEDENNARIAELAGMQDQEQALNQVLVEHNPITESVRLLLLVAAQDLAMFGTLTNDWLTVLATALGQDNRAIMTGEFAFEFVAGGVVKTEKSKEKFPLHMLENDRAYVALLNIYRSAPADFRTSIQDKLFNVDGNVINVDLVSLLTSPAFPVHSDPKKNQPKNITNALAHYKVEGRVDPLNHLFKQIMSLMMFVSIVEISPKHDVPHAQFLQDATISRERLNKVIAGRAPSRLVRYIQMALVAQQDKDALASLTLQDQNNPFYGVLVSNDLVQANDFSAMEARDFIKVQIAMEQLANNSTGMITPENINNRYVVIHFLKKMLKLGAENSASEVKKLAGDFELAVVNKLNDRRLAGDETEIDVLMLQAYDDYTCAMHAVFVEHAKGAVTFKLDAASWMHTCEAKASRSLTATHANNVRRSSLSSELQSPVPKVRSASTVSTPSSSPDSTSPAVVAVNTSEEPVRTRTPTPVMIARFDNSAPESGPALASFVRSPVTTAVETADSSIVQLSDELTARVSVVENAPRPASVPTNQPPPPPPPAVAASVPASQPPPPPPPAVATPVLAHQPPPPPPAVAAPVASEAAESAAFVPVQPAVSSESSLPAFAVSQSRQAMFGEIRAAGEKRSSASSNVDAAPAAPLSPATLQTSSTQFGNSPAVQAILDRRKTMGLEENDGDNDSVKSSVSSQGW